MKKNVHFLIPLLIIFFVLIIRNYFLSSGNETMSEAENRKQRSQKILTAKNIPINQSLPLIETEKDSLRRSKTEIAERAIALYIISYKATGALDEYVQDLLKQFDADTFFSPDEKIFIENVNPTDHEILRFSWRIESCWVLLWTLGYVPELEYPDDLCDVPHIQSVFDGKTKKQIIEDAILRPQSEILDEADLIYRYRWALEDFRYHNKPNTTDLDSGVCLERHYTLNWLIGYMDQEWDDITTDT